MKKTQPLSHRLDPDIKAALQRLADADDRSLTNYVERILVAHVLDKGLVRSERRKGEK